MSIQIDASLEVRTFFAIFNSVVCLVLFVIRLYHWKNGKPVVIKLSLTGSSCILVATLCCFALLNQTTEVTFGDMKFCDFSLRLTLSTYALHRALLYLFIILRLEVVNQIKFMNPRIITLGIVVIAIFGILMVVTTTLSVHGTADNFRKCTLVMKNEIIVPFFVIDGLICAAGTWMFMLPLRNTLRSIEHESISQLLEKTRTWSLVSLICTMMSMLTIAFTDGAGGVIGCDCSITSFSLVMMMAPVRPKEAGNYAG